jgi:hypothetical protein
MGWVRPKNAAIVRGQSLLSPTANDGTVTRALDLGRLPRAYRNELSSSLQASFSEVDVVLDATKDFIVDRFLVA